MPGPSRAVPPTRAGLTEGDTITAPNGAPITSPEALADVLLGEKPGDSAVVAIQFLDQSGQQQSTSVTLASGPAQSSLQESRTRWPNVGGWHAVRTGPGERWHP